MIKKTRKTTKNKTNFKIAKTFVLDLKVIKRLKKEENQSALINGLLLVHYGMLGNREKRPLFPVKQEKKDK